MGQRAGHNFEVLVQLSSEVRQAELFSLNKKFIMTLEILIFENFAWYVCFFSILSTLKMQNFQKLVLFIKFKNVDFLEKYPEIPFRFIFERYF